MATGNDARCLALERLDRQEHDAREEAREKRERSQAYVKVKQKEYQEMKAEYERVFRADMELNNAVQRNTQKIAERRRQLEAGEDNKVWQPLILEPIQAPGPVETNRPAKKKGLAKKAAISTRKSQYDQDDHQFRTHRKEIPGAVAAGKTARTWRLRSDADNKQIDPDPVEEEEQQDDVEGDAETEDVEDQDRAQRESSAETVLSHITVKRKGSMSRDPTPVAQDPELPLLPFDDPLDQQLEQPGDVLPDDDEQRRMFEDAMQWAAEPLSDLELFAMPDAPMGEVQGDLDISVEDPQPRAASPALSIATSSSSGLFVSERPRRRSSTPRAYREPPAVVYDDHISPDLRPQALPFTGDGHGFFELESDEKLDQSASPSIFSPELPALHTSDREDSLFGETLDGQQSGMDVDQDIAQLPTPDPSGCLSRSREPSEKQHPSPSESTFSDGAGLFVPEDAPLPVRSDQRDSTRPPVKRRSTEGAESNQEPAKKKGKRKKSFLESVLSKIR